VINEHTRELSQTMAKGAEREKERENKGCTIKRGMETQRERGVRAKIYYDGVRGWEMAKERKRGKRVLRRTEGGGGRENG